ncbi:hypothetical protein P691DRAFT_786047 [Macrolepiota fuliginosa MF-IS2]|uniref:Uncharacterized protein n=1 Tax=Macrolepiota fuliginosa MF-IS2 TaxID=1400762 RepID=A0A9P6BY70_9AGAR|nr:hypothetical protein P691DRAFT_786047 [Macrolepiota fuliginosa MF-IS2]
MARVTLTCLISNKRLPLVIDAGDVGLAVVVIPRHSTPPIASNLIFLRLTHATLLESHGSILASLRHVKSTSATLTSQLVEFTQAIDALKDQIKLAKDDTRKVDVQARLAEHEVGFFKSLMIHAWFPLLYHPSNPSSSRKTLQALLGELASLKSRLSESETTNTELEEKVDKSSLS